MDEITKFLTKSNLGNIVGIATIVIIGATIYKSYRQIKWYKEQTSLYKQQRVINAHKLNGNDLS